MELKIGIKTEQGVDIPMRATKGASGVDLRCKELTTLKPGQRKLVSTGIYLEIPYGYEAQIRPRSGLALIHGVTVLNTPGTIDCDYRGEIKVLLINRGHASVLFNPNERIAQMVFAKVEQPIFYQIPEDFIETERGDGGFGHTGLK